ncbi:MAG TPA: isoaspartyl peptidase/L-asparaginase [Acidimicrobiia bacterium]|nr:isoaspartyl peptidase/L-asparaginase [Acidimicrobiia bacterium]
MVSTGSRALILHGGVDNPPTDLVRGGLQAAWRSGTAEDTVMGAVVAAVAHLEDDENFNAGRGSVLNAEGEVETDAAVVDPSTGRYAGVGALRGFRNPVKVARALLDRRGPVLLVGEGAASFARDAGLETSDLVTPDQVTALRAGSEVNPFTGLTAGDTVGAIGLDADLRVAVASSTGGVLGKWPGRVGDAPVFGAGIYATGTVAVLSSGQGEHSLRNALAARIGMDCEAGRPARESVEAAIATARDDNATSALLVVDIRQKVVVAGHSGASFPLVIDGEFVSVAPDTILEVALPTPIEERSRYAN